MVKMKRTKKRMGSGIERVRRTERRPDDVKPSRRARVMRHTEMRFWKASVNHGKWKWACEKTTLFMSVTAADVTA